jgi:putative sigma-54 modulation protein
MHIAITGRHLEITPDVREFIEARVEKLTRFVDAVELQVTITAEKSRHRAEMQLRDSAGSYYAAEEGHHDLYGCLDQALERLEAQAKKYREKLIESHHGRRAQEAKLNFLSAEQEEPEQNFGPY